MKKPLLFVILGLVIVFGGVFGFYVFKQYMINKYLANYAPPASVISTAVVKSGDWTPYIFAVGNLTAVNGVDISPEVLGQVKSIMFTSGQSVKAGQPLIQLDDTSERAQQKSIEAQLQLAEITQERTLRLLGQKASTQAALDDANASVNQLKGNLENINSSISKKLIRAPFNGKIGINQINVGQFIAAGQVCASLQTTDALYVKFSLAQKDLAKVALKQKVILTADAYPGEEFYGYVSAIDSKLDDNTHTIQIQAAMDNSNKKLYPGMFADVKLELPVEHDTLVLPQTSVVYTLYGESVFVVKLNGKKDDAKRDMGTVTRVSVSTGDKQNNLAVIKEGLKAGDIVVSAGQSKIDNGSTVAIDNSIKL